LLYQLGGRQFTSQTGFRLREYRSVIASLGVFGTVAYSLQRLGSRCIRTDKPFLLYSKHARYRLRCRPNTSDIEVFRQVFENREYSCLDDVHEAYLIIDCGANVGYSSAYFLSRFPESYVIAVEPDEANFSLLKTNVAAYGSRCRAICSAVWSHPVGLVMSEMPFGDGREWARTVRTPRDGETPTMKGVDIGTLLNDSGYDRISILKIDIEGAESIIFSSNYESWIGKVDNLVIEIHGDGCLSPFRNAISGRPFCLSQCGELTVCKRSSSLST